MCVWLICWGVIGCNRAALSRRWCCVGNRRRRSRMWSWMSEWMRLRVKIRCGKSVVGVVFVSVKSVGCCDC